MRRLKTQDPLVTAARIVADTISSDPAKIETYCAIGKLSDQIEDANEKKDSTTADELNSKNEGIGRKTGSRICFIDERTSEN